MLRTLTLLTCMIGCCLSSSAAARTWTSAKGGYTLDADAIAFNESSVILKKKTGKLVSVDLAELSEADTEYVRSKEVSERLSDSVEQMQTWTSKEGLKIRARVLAYGRKDLTIGRKLGKPIINGVAFDKLDPLHQKLLLVILSELEDKTFANARDLYEWATALGAETKSTNLEGVLLELESGDQLAVPFFLFNEEALKVLQPGWETWKAANEDQAAKQRESLMMKTEAMQYQQQRQIEQQQQQYERQQVEVLRLNLLAAATGVTSIWEVGLQPPIGFHGRRTSVMVTARNSDQATQMALAQHPGYRVFGVRKASR